MARRPTPFTSSSRRRIRRMVAAAAAMYALTAAHAAPETSGAPPAPAAKAFRLGALQVVALRDADVVVANDAKIFGVDAGPPAVAEVLRAAGLPTDKVSLAVDALLVKAPGRVMLFDAGLGPPAHGALVASLAEVGLTPAQVTDVFITHSHRDHVGGLATADGRSAFPNAVIRMSSQEWAWMQDQAGSQAVVKIIAPQVRTFEPGHAISPWVTPLAIEGHTPGHVGYEIVSDGARLLDIGDTAHSAVVSLARPDWTLGFDGDAATGKRSRRATLTRLARSEELIFAPHFPFPGVGRIKAAGEGFVWVPAT